MGGELGRARRAVRSRGDRIGFCWKISLLGTLLARVFVSFGACGHQYFKCTSIMLTFSWLTEPPDAFQKTFSQNGENTIEPKSKTNLLIGQRDGLSPGDVIQARLLYGCPSECG